MVVGKRTRSAPQVLGLASVDWLLAAALDWMDTGKTRHPEVVGGQDNHFLPVFFVFAKRAFSAFFSCAKRFMRDSRQGRQFGRWRRSSAAPNTSRQNGQGSRGARHPREHPLVFAKLHFMFDPVRERPRFQAILRELRLA
jgi:hypothetical protein